MFQLTNDDEPNKNEEVSNTEYTSSMPNIENSPTPQRSFNTFDLKNMPVSTKKKKLSTKTKIILFLVTFAVLSIGITIGAIFYINTTNDNNVDGNVPKPEFSNPTENSNQPDDGLGIKLLTETYDENDLRIVEVKDNKGSRTPLNEWDTNTGKINISYIQIAGLRNGAIQSSINDEIKSLVYSLVTDEDLNNSNIDQVTISAYYTANFGNVLSVTITKNTVFIDNSANKNNTVHYQDYYLNYNLTNGNHLKFTDLFTNSSLRNALSQAVYDDVLNNYLYNDNSFDPNTGIIDASKIDLSMVEDETYILVNKIMDNLDKIKFYFSPSFISCEIDGEEIILSMQKIYKQIAIYNRFKTNTSIFDGSYSGNKSIFVLSTRYLHEDTAFACYENVGNNLRIEVCVDGTTENKVLQDYSNTIIQHVKEEIANVKKLSSSNTNKGYLYTAYFSVTAIPDNELTQLNIDNSLVQIYGQSHFYTMSFDYYNDTVLPAVADCWRADVPFAIRTFDDEMLGLSDEIRKNIEIKSNEIREENLLDINTGKTKEQLLGEYYLNEQITALKTIQSGSITFTSNSELNSIEKKIDSIKSTYKLSDEDIAEAVKLLAETRLKVKEALEKPAPEPEPTPEPTPEPEPTPDPDESELSNNTSNSILDNTVDNTT